LKYGTVAGVGTSWQTVELGLEYESMVVVAAAQYDASKPATVVRVRNASGSSFDVRVQAADGSGSVSGITVHYMVVEEGVYTTGAHGVKMEAVKYTSTSTDSDSSWSAQSRSYQQSYSNPVVLGQVMTYNDVEWSVFWARGGDATDPPSASTLRMGKHVGEDSDTSRANETIGYIVLEQGSGAINGVGYVAALGASTVQGVDNGPPFTYTLSGSLTSPTVAVVSQGGMNGTNGSWPLLYGSSPVASTYLRLAVDEDEIGDAERSHPSEQVAYIVFAGTPPATPTPTPSPTPVAYNLLVADEDDTVYRYDTSGGYIGSWSLHASNSSPRGMLVDSGTVYVMDNSGDGFLYSTGGAYIVSTSLHSSNTQPRGVAYDGSVFYVADDGTNTLFKYSGSNGEYLGQVTLHAGNTTSTGVARSGNNLYVSDSGDDRVYVYTLSGLYVTRWSLNAGNGDSRGITTNGANIWVVDDTQNAVYVYTMSGAFVTSWTLTGANSQARGIGVYSP
jgi:hypothetical protein